MTHGGVNVELRSVLRWNYTGITRANYILEHQDNIDFPGKAHIIAEAKFLRAYYYFELVKFFGDVPLILDKRIGIEEARSIPRSPKSEVYAQIEADLIAASAVLNPTASQKGRATKGAAKSLLGKVYLYQNKFTEAAEILEEVIASGQYSLYQDYSTLFSVAAEGNPETVFDIEYTGLEGGSYGCLICLEGNAAVGFQGIRQYNGPVYGDGNSYNLPTPELYAAFSPIDSRREATVLDIEAFIAAQPNAASITYAIGAGGHTGYYNNKYIKRQGEIGLPDNDLTSPVNYRVIRYADVLLMAAEANYQIGNPTRATQLVNQIRQRAGIPGASVNSVEKVYLERRLELSGEGHRFFDLVRTGQAAQFIPGFVTGKHELFPIPQVEIDLAGGNWTQNPGY
jgi:tetratricopeptide (TPR) repeat protein